MTGPGAGRRAVFTEAPVTFGRESDNALIVPDKIISRRHGEFRLDKDGWLLVNLSPNGTKVGRNLVTDKPRRLRDRDVVSVGDQPLFKVGIEAAAAGPAAGRTTASAGSGGRATVAADGKQPLSKRAKLWLWITCSLSAVLIVAIVVGQSFRDVTHKDSSEAAAVLSDKDIADEIRTPPPRAQDLNPDLAHQKIAEAMDAAREARMSKATLYKAYHSFQEALALLGQKDFNDKSIPPEVGLAYADVQNALIEEVQRQYRLACSLRSPSDAAAAFFKVTQTYPDQNSQIYKKCCDQYEEAKRRIPKRQSGP